MQFVNQKINIDKSNPVPLYVQLATSLKDIILKGELKYGDRLPSEHELMESLGVSRMTIRSALSTLESEHYIHKQHGLGTFVCFVERVSAGSIDVLLDVKDAYFSPYYIQQISMILENNNYRFNIHDTRDSSSEITKLLSKISVSGSSGIIIEPPHSMDTDSTELRNAIFAIRQSGIPYIFIDHDIEGIPGNRMIVDDYYGGREAAVYLLGLGHKRIAYQLKSGYIEYHQRLAGLNDTLRSNNADPALVFSLNENSAAHLKNLIRENGITAIFCSNDEGALEVMHILQNSGLRIPEDISIVGYDDTIIALATKPQLTSITHPKGLLGKMAAEALMNYRINHTQINDKYIKPSIHKRDSCQKYVE